MKLSSKSRLELIINYLIKNINFLNFNISLIPYADWELKKHIPHYEKHVNELIENLKTFDYRGEWPGTSPYTFNNRILFSDSKVNHF